MRFSTIAGVRFSSDCFFLQAVNLVNGMIVDGLGHVSLDSSPAPVQQQPLQGNFSQANIHQGSILATGRKLDSINSAAAGVSSSSGRVSTPMSAANSLQFNQLIGGAISPSLVSNGAGGVAMAQASAAIPSVQQQQQLQQQHGLNLTNHQHQPAVNANLMIGDYAQAGGLSTAFRQ